MCGFAGFFGGDIADRRGPAEKMGERIAHRGPDDSGIFDDGRAALSFRRLSIIDLDRGVQPMKSEDDRPFLWSAATLNEVGTPSAEYG